MSTSSSLEEHNKNSGIDFVNKVKIIFQLGYPAYFSNLKQLIEYNYCDYYINEHS